MDEFFFDNLFKGLMSGLRLGWMFGMAVNRGVSLLKGAIHPRSSYEKLISEQRKADQYDEAGHPQDESLVRAQIVRRRGGR